MSMATRVITRIRRYGSASEQRVAPRSSLLMRTAKLLCESGEYVCVVRDVSTTGAKLRLFHAPPPDRYMFLELGNGERYAMECMWSRDQNAGFRFSCAIDVNEFIQEAGPYPKRPVRLKLRRPAQVLVGDDSTPAMLCDLSQQGACIEASREFAIGQPLRVAIEGLPVRTGCIRWRRDHTHGLVFQETLGLDELAGYARAFQPYVQPGTTPPDGQGSDLVRYA
jgi:hypothetical protein